MARHQDPLPIDPLPIDDQLKLVVFIPDSHHAAVKRALFDAGAGTQGHYDSCAFEQKGQGQFRPQKGSTPFVGDQEQLTQVVEWRVEMLVPRDCLSEVIIALRAAHPYEEPAFDVFTRVRLAP